MAAIRKQIFSVQGEELPDDQKEIFDIQFSFDNTELIKLLEKRGDALRVADFDKVIQVEKKMTALKNKEGNLEKFCTPKFMWITF